MAILLQVVKRTEKQTGTTWAFTARQFAFGGATFVNRVIYIDGGYADELFDLNLKSAHDRRYDPASLTAGSIVEFIITSGVLVSGSTTSTYALTNPNTWPSGVFVRLVIESGAIVAGRGGNGGNGAYRLASGGIVDYAATNGENGGNGLIVQYPLTIENNGIIGGGGGGGGGGSAASYLFDEAGGGGGGAALGIGGIRGNINGVNNWPAQNGENANPNNINGGYGGLSAGYSSFVAGNGGNGGDLGQDGQDGQTALQNNQGIGGTAGDAIHGISYITWVNMGTIYGATS